ncbi:MAG: hypothetical protein DIJKHBIC_01397 [Thermoanaerobaculia bacterium]|nr:hypothetical protein [Thermoanaerobaculia bacterium]
MLRQGGAGGNGQTILGGSREWRLVSGAFEAVRKYDLDGSGNDLKMGEWRQTSSSTGPVYSRRLELRSVLGVPLAVMEDKNLVAPLDASLTGAISFLYWNVLGKLSRSQDDGRAEDGPAPSMVLPSTPESVPAQARAWTWDGSGLLLAESHPEISGAITNTAFDGLGNVTSQNEAGTLHTFVYDRAGRLTSHTGSDGTYVSPGWWSEPRGTSLPSRFGANPRHRRAISTLSRSPCGKRSRGSGR